MSTNLNGTLDLAGTLVLREKVLVGGAEALVVVPEDGATVHGMATVRVPPPPQPSPDPGLAVRIVSSDNESVLAGARAIVTSGTCKQGLRASWPGKVRPSQGNQGVRIGGTAICVVGDQGDIDRGGPVVFTTSGQG